MRCGAVRYGAVRCGAALCANQNAICAMQCYDSALLCAKCKAKYSSSIVVMVYEMPQLAMAYAQWIQIVSAQCLVLLKKL